MVEASVPAARPGEFRPLDLGPLQVWPPVILAPMAGVTNQAFRRICREQGAGLCVSEMINARGIVEGQKKTRRLAAFGGDEPIRSLQLYGTDPAMLGEATRRLVGEGAVDHLDLNFGCPVRKVTAAGGGAAIPVRPRLMARLVRAVVGNAGDVPVTLKVRLGIDEDLLTWRDSGRVAEEEGCRAIGLHARTAAQLYDGTARWESIAELRQTVRDIRVLGNGDIWEGVDALRMMRETGCDGVIVGRGCLGRPWLFHELKELFEGRDAPAPPRLGETVPMLLRHADLLVDLFGPRHGIQELRKWCSWYLKGYPGTAPLRDALFRATTREEVARTLAEVDPEAGLVPGARRARRAKRAGTQKVALPDGYRDDRDSDQPHGLTLRQEREAPAVSGG